MTTIFQSATASSAPGGTLQTTYVAGNTISVTDAEGVVAFSSAAASTVAVQTITTDAAASGAALEIINNGSGNALLIKDGSTPVLTISPAGAITGVATNNGATVGSAVSFTGGVAVAGVGGDVALTGGASGTGKPGAITLTSPRAASTGAGSQINGAGLGVAYAVAIGRSRLTLFSRDGLAWFTG